MSAPLRKGSALERTRTFNLRFRRPMLYPIELPVQRGQRGRTLGAPLMPVNCVFRLTSESTRRRFRSGRQGPGPEPLRHEVDGGTRARALAETEGFEPSIELLTLYTLSRRAPSATRPCLHKELTNCRGVRAPARGSGRPPRLLFTTFGALRRTALPRRTMSRFSREPSTEEEGFEPPRLASGGFQDRCLQPLGHSSTKRRKG